MRADRLPTVCGVLANPGTLQALSAPQWDILVRQARAAGLLGRVAWLARSHGLWDLIPAGPAAHLRWGEDFASACHREVAYEVDCVCRALRRIDERPVLLKGAAYVAGGLLASRGRFFEDVDILVPRERLGEVESALLLGGWDLTHLDAYDQRYYRQWMHELPPLRHRQRGSSLDVHHALLPPTGRLHPDPALIRRDAVEVADGVWIPCPEDLLLHSAAHLFHDGELEHGLRDLSDMQLLLREFGSGAGFWERLLDRARHHQLGRPLYLALRYLQQLLDLTVPAEACRDLDRLAPAGAFYRRWADFAFRRALLPAHPSCEDGWTEPVRLGLYVRSHWLKMPPLLLARHLARKAWRHWRDDADQVQPGPADQGDA